MKRTAIVMCALMAGAGLRPAAAAYGDGKDAEALSVLAAVNENEINAANEAATKNVPSRVADFAKMMKKEHTENLDKTRRLADKVGVAPDSTNPAEREKAEGRDHLATLSPLDGTTFAVTYIDLMVQAHAKALKTLDEYVGRASNPEVKKHLQETREKVAKHLDHAKDIQASLSR